MAKSSFWVLGRDDECIISYSIFLFKFASVTLVEEEEEEKTLRPLQ
jgi:hypothetical protein